MYRQAELSQYERSYANFRDYPHNLVQKGSYKYNANQYAKRLRIRAEDIFAEKSNIRFWDYDDQCQQFCKTLISDLSSLQTFFTDCGRQDPKCRFTFISAFSNRSALDITKEMLFLLLTRHQITPAFLDFIMGFGKRHYDQKLPFNGFRAERRLSDSSFGAFSGCERGLWICYNLRSVEAVKVPKSSWSIRCTAVYQSFDVVTGRAFWIVVKANDKMEKRIVEHTKTSEQSDLYASDTNSQSMAAAIEGHLVFVDWASENWGWYIDSLEDEMHETTHRALNTPAEAAEPQLIREPGPSTVHFSRAATMASVDDPSFRPHSVSRSLTGSTEVGDMDDSDPKQFRVQLTELGLMADSPNRVTPQTQFRLDALQRSQNLEERANEAVQTLESSKRVLKSLVHFYTEMVAAKDFPPQLREACKASLLKLGSRVRSVNNEFDAQVSRARALVRILSDRKAVLSAIVDFHSMEASRDMAAKSHEIAAKSHEIAARSHQTAQNMETMTLDMHEIAHKTKMETVSMRIITLVTLAFLPGTFISTFMSTDVIRWRSSDSSEFQQSVSSDALFFFLATSIPITVVTFMIWWSVSFYLSRKRKGEPSPVARSGSLV